MNVFRPGLYPENQMTHISYRKLPIVMLTIALLALSLKEKKQWNWMLSAE